MKILYSLCILLVMCTPCFGEDMCEDLQDAVTTAIDERNTTTTAIHNTAMSDPEEDRDALSS